MKDPLDVIPKEEGYLCEFKAFSGGLSAKEISRTVCAFANTEGGEVYVGVSDSRRPIGVRVTAGLLDKIQNAAREGVSPPVPVSLKKIKITTQKSVIRISVQKSAHLHSVTAGQTYIRVGTQDKRIVGDELLRLAESKTQVSYEETVLDAGMEVIDHALLDQYYEARKAVSAMGGRLSAEELLAKMGLAEMGATGFRIKAGAFILFGKEEQSILLQRDCTFVKYEVEGKMYTYREDISLPGIRLLDRLMELIRPYNRTTRGVRGLKREDHVTYPEEALREVIVNAFAHRDYRIAGLKNECRMYPDRMEIISAGGLPSFITLRNMETRHYSRNPKIMHALLIMGLVEELGQGISLMKRALKQNGNPPPEFDVGPDEFKVIFTKERVSKADLDIREILSRHFSSDEYVTRRQIESLTGLGSTSAKRLVKDLIREGHLEVVGGGPHTKYRRKSEENTT
jgi:ATP-dependent DNA helicase RecG